MKTHTPISRSPRGVSTTPVYLRLMPAELDALRQLAAGQNCSLSAMARTIFLRGAALAKPTEISRPGEEI